jgi:hypothetical protein
MLDKLSIRRNLAKKGCYLGFAEKVFPGGRVWGVGCGGWGFTSFEVANYLICREKVPKFPPDHCHIQDFLIDKRSKSLTQQGF